MPTIKEECPSCSGTGLYSGFAEAQGEAVICLGCEGKGWTNYSYKEFTGRKLKRGIKSISLSRDSFLATGVGKSMTYQEFEEKYKEK